MVAKIKPIDSVILRWPTVVAHTWLTEFVRKVAADENVLAVIAVGSTIRSEVESDDLDLVVLCEERKRFRYKSPIEVDIRTFVLTATEEDLSAGHPLLGWAVKFGQALFDRNGTWEKLVSTWRDRVPLPDPLLARKRADKIFKYLTAVREIGDDAAAAELHLSYLTFLARAALSEQGIYPTSRPELPGQLRTIDEVQLATRLETALRERTQKRTALDTNHP